MKTNSAAIYAPVGSRKGLPAWTYHNSELTQLEIDRVTLSHWLFVGHIADIPEPGDYLSLDLGNERAMVVRGRDGTIRAFHNVCRHRASRLVCERRGNCGKALVCPFHGWTYQLDGQLKQIPRADAFPPIDKNRYGLKPIACDIWHGLIFVRFHGDGPSVAAQFAEAEAEVGLYRIEEMQPYGENWRYDLDVDWKAVVDIDNEGYHVPVGHPELFDLMGTSYCDQQLSNTLNRAQGDLDRGRWKTESVRSYVEALPEESYLPDSHRRLWVYYGLFPGFVVSLFPDLVEIYQVYPVGSQLSVMTGGTYALPDDRETMANARRLNRAINLGVGDEDVDLIRWAAEGMRSSAFDGQLLGGQENCVVTFHDRMRELLPVVTLEQAPEPGTLGQVNDQLLTRERVAANA